MKVLYSCPLDDVVCSTPGEGTAVEYLQHLLAALAAEGAATQIVNRFDVWGRIEDNVVSDWLVVYVNGGKFAEGPLELVDALKAYWEQH